jgi:hypothetical protein
MIRRKKECFFCGENSTEAIDLHHRIPRSIIRQIPLFIRSEVLDEIFGRNSQRLYPLCGSCHRKIHYILRPFTKSISIFSDMDGPEKKIIHQKKMTKLLAVIRAEGGKEGEANLEPIVHELQENGISNEEAVELLVDLRDDGDIYFVLPDEPSAKMDPYFVNRITYT